MPKGQFYCGFLEHLSLEKNSFDIVISDNVVEHMKNPDDFVRSLQDYVKPNGKIVLFVPNGRSYTVRHLKQYALNVWPPFHVNLFTPQYFTQHFSDINFKIQARSHFFTLMQSFRRAGYSRWKAIFKSLLLLPFAKEELVIIYGAR